MALLREVIKVLDERRDRLMKHKPQGKVRNTQELEAELRRKQEQMTHSSLSIKQEKAMMMEMKRMKEDNKKNQAWEQEMDEVRTKRSQLQEELRQAFSSLDQNRTSQWLVESAASLGLELESVVEERVAVPEGMVEMLATVHWAQRLKRDHRVCVKADRAPKKEDAKTGTIRLAGDADAVATAAKFIAEFGEVAVRKVSVDEEQQGLLIGKGGSTIRQLQETTVRRAHCSLARSLARRRRCRPPPPTARCPPP